MSGVASKGLTPLAMTIQQGEELADQGNWMNEYCGVSVIHSAPYGAENLTWTLSQDFILGYSHIFPLEKRSRLPLRSGRAPSLLWSRLRLCFGRGNRAVVPSIRARKKPNRRTRVH